MLITCGNGGDYEFERDRLFWMYWIKYNITDTGFAIISDEICKGNQANLVFDDPQYEIIFKLKAPPWITFKDIQEYIQ